MDNSQPISSSKIAAATVIWLVIAAAAGVSSFTGSAITSAHSLGTRLDPANSFLVIIRVEAKAKSSCQFKRFYSI